MSHRRPMPRKPAPKSPDGQFCPHYARGSCTGCTRLHVPYAEQTTGKEAWVKETLEKVLGRATWQSIAPSPKTMGYRTSIKLCLQEDREGRRAVGLYRQGTREVAHVPDCPAADPQLTKLIAKLFRRELRPPARFYDHKGRSFQKGRLKFLIARHAPDGGSGLILVHTGVPREALSGWLAKAGLGDVCAYESRLTPADGSELVGRRVEYLSGPQTFTFPLAGVAFELSPEAFFQANHSLSAALVQAATAFAKDGDVLLDLYGGFGAYSFAVRHRFKEIHVVDGNQAATRAATQAAARLGLKTLSAHGTLCEKFLSGLTSDTLARVTHVIVNPPRNGLSRAVTDAFRAARMPELQELAYVSCNPVTLARDVEHLVSLGFALKSARPFDMFPQTDHVESVVHLVRGSNPLHSCIGAPPR